MKESTIITDENNSSESSAPCLMCMKFLHLQLTGLTQDGSGIRTNKLLTKFLGGVGAQSWGVAIERVDHARVQTVAMQTAVAPTKVNLH